ncbi:hypothetical protein [Aeromonas salmonicida]|uniref:hypothetical protein n=1 Tax=Aeromonas salmonicida TaxID=645 RepID=UPI003D70A201
MKRFTHDADLRGMVVLRSLGFQLVPFKLHRFRKQRPVAYKPMVHTESLLSHFNFETELFFSAIAILIAISGRDREITVSEMM